jgi:dynamin 1-like protein
VGTISLDDDDEDSSSSTTGDNMNISNGSGPGGRSVSNTVHDRARVTNSSSTPPVGAGSQTAHNGTVSRQSLPARTSAHSHQQLSAQSSTSTSPHTAKETFLNYFFGQNGPGPMAASAGFSGDHHRGGNGFGRGAVVGRDTSGPEFASNGMAPRRSMDGNDAAYDMKSLGKHIEAVSSSIHTLKS